MKILLTGAAGQLGRELHSHVIGLADVLAVDLHSVLEEAFSCRPLDLTDRDALLAMLGAEAPDLVINAAAYTAVDRAEDEPDQAHAVNERVPAWLAEWAASTGAGLLHYSTDYVFDGRTSRPYRESDEPAPLSVYGKSKLAGERAVVASGCRHLIFRSSWIYSSHGRNFVLTMLDLARRRSRLQVVDDQKGCPTWAGNLAAYSMQAIHAGFSGNGAQSGIYHCCDADIMSWYDFAALIFQTAVDLDLLSEAPALERVTSDDFPQVASRPSYSALDTSAVRKRFGIRPRGVQDSLRECMKDLKDE